MRKLEFDCVEFIRLLDQYLAELLDENEKLVISELCKLMSSKKSSKLCRVTIKELVSRSKIKKLKTKELYKIIERLERKGFVKGVKPLRRRGSRKAILCLACSKLSGFIFFLEMAKQLHYYKPKIPRYTSLDEPKILETLSQLKTLEKNIHLFSSLIEHPDFSRFLKAYQKHFLSAIRGLLHKRLVLCS